MLPWMRGLRTETLKKVGRPLAKDGSNTSPGSSSSSQIVSALLLLLCYPVKGLDRRCHAEHHVVLFSRGHGRNLADDILVGQFENHTGIWWEDQQGRKQCLTTVGKL